MCIGGSSPKPAPAPAQAAPVTASAPKLDQEVFDQETSSETQKRRRKGKRSLRIERNASVQTNSSGTGLNIPTS